METKRIVLVDGAHLLSEMLGRIINRVEDLSVVATISDLSALPDLVHQKPVDWIVFSQQTDGALSAEIEALFKEFPSIYILTIAIDTGEIKIDWVRRRKKKIKISTVEELTETLRAEPVS